MEWDDDDDNAPVVDLTYEEEQKMDDDLDFALAYCLQTDFEDDTIADNVVSKEELLGLKKDSGRDYPSDEVASNWKNEKKVNVGKEKDADYLLALQLQAEFSEESGMNNNPYDISNDKTKLLNKNEKWLKGSRSEDPDYLLALQLQAELAEGSGANSSQPNISSVKSKQPNQNVQLLKQKGGKQPSSIVDPEWEVLDPIPDIHGLFLQFNNQFFWGRLEGVEVRWSPRMTLCAGVCCYEGRGGLCSVRLSQPLLKYRPRRDLVETLLHEMIHAYLFVTHNNKDHDAHGPEFLKHMHRINQQTGTRISVYHSFHDEVDLHRKHWWKCNGPCQRRSPFFGLVKRAMNRAPSPRDPWWAQHQATCGGTYIKIKEPEISTQKKNLKRKSDVTEAKPGLGDIRTFFPGNSPANKENQKLSNVESSIRRPGVANIHTVSTSPVKSSKDTSTTVPFSGKGHVLGTLASGSKTNGPPFKNGANFPSRLLENNVTKVPPIRNSFRSQKKETKKPWDSTIQRNPSSNSQVKNKQLGSLNTSASSKMGTGLKFSSAGGSRTIVIPKNQKAPQATTVKSPSNLPVVTFKGEGVILGGGSRASSEKESKFSRGTVLPSTSGIKKESNSGGLLDDSFEEIFPKASNSKRNTKSEKSESPFSKKTNTTQSKIDFYAVSPKGKSISNIKTESERETVNNSNQSQNVKCPVCGSMFSSFAINAHLDCCLQKYS